MELFVYLNGARRGPFARERLQAWLRDGLLQGSDLASTTLENELRPLSSFSAEEAATPRTPAPIGLHPKSIESLPVASAQSHEALLSLARESLGPYARATLAPNETPFHRTNLHWIVFLRFAVLALLVFFFLALPFAIAVQALAGSQLGWFSLPLPMFILVPPALAYASSELVITDLRVLIKTGLVQRQTIEMFISKVESVAVDQGVLGRLFDYGTVAIRGTGGHEERFEAIARPLAFRNWVQRMQSGASSAGPK